jgi:hypothetical protein
MLGIERASVNTWIQGRHTPSSRNIEKLSLIFGVEVNWLRDDAEHFPPPGDRRFSRGAASRKDGDTGRNEEAPDKEEGAGKQAAGEDRSGNQPIEIINDNLLRVNHPRLRALFHQLEKALREKDAGRVSGLCGRLDMLLRREAGGKKIEFFPMEEKEGSQDA